MPGGFAIIVLDGSVLVGVLFCWWRFGGWRGFGGWVWWQAPRAACMCLRSGRNYLPRYEGTCSRMASIRCSCFMFHVHVGSRASGWVGLPRLLGRSAPILLHVISDWFGQSWISWLFLGQRRNQLQQSLTNNYRGVTQKGIVGDWTKTSICKERKKSMCTICIFIRPLGWSPRAIVNVSSFLEKYFI